MIAYDETRVRMIAGDLRASITQDDKLYILALAQSLGVEKSGCKTCPNYYQDLALIIYTNMSKKKTKQVEPETDAKYLLKEGVNVIFGGVPVNAASLTDELGDWLIGHGFPRKFFAKVSGNAD